ncbi:MAG: ABC transporter ATP-binding protein [Desulfamplus sp.]|nr:ABC transporter ATP-binding protein [Desulfamplus sp.]
MKNYHLLKPYIFECRFHIVAGFLSLFIVDMLQLFVPRIIKWAIDSITIKSEPLTSAALDKLESGLFNYAFYIVGSAALISIFRFCWRYLIMGAAKRTEEGIREELFNHIQTLPATFFDKHTAGDIMAHATNDMANIRMALGMGLVGLTDTIVLGSTAILFMVYINLELTILALLPMPFIALFTKIFSKKLFDAYIDVQSGFSDLMESTRERFAGIRIIKAFNRQPLELATMQRESESFVKKNIYLVRIRGFIFPMVIFLTQISLAVIIGVGGRKVITSQISTGDFVAFISYLGLLTWPVMAIGWVTNMIQRGTASLDRINAILKIQGKSEIINPDDSKKEIDIKGEIEFSRVSFSYSGSVDTLLDVSFKVKKGEMLGIAGTPGSGKSTLINLIPRIYDIDQGSIKVDGIDIKDISIQTLRRAISFVPQEPFLFSGTIKDNIMFGDVDADLEKIAKALEMAQLTDTIASFPKDIDTIIGEKGVMLSGGQKQRIAIARAFLKVSPILILDDPISQVDMQTASKIIKIVESLAGKVTVLVASHRFSIFKRADHIIVLDKGRVVEKGTHGYLVDKNGYYSRAWQMQDSDDDLKRG